MITSLPQTRMEKDVRELQASITRSTKALIWFMKMVMHCLFLLFARLRNAPSFRWLHSGTFIRAYSLDIIPISRNYH